MQLKLPPGISSAGFSRALQAFEGAVGRDWVLATDADRTTYGDVYAVGSKTNAPSAAVAPPAVEKCRRSSACHQHRASCSGRPRAARIGYGHGGPARRIGSARSSDAADPRGRTSACVIEPGVGFFDLYEHIQANDIPLMRSVPGNAWGSVIGNALERGIGYTPMGNHTRNLCGMEVVMPDGDLLRTGMGAMEGNHAWHCFPYSFGPGIEQLFCQSNLGIVTPARLMPARDPALAFDEEREDDIA